MSRLRIERILCKSSPMVLGLTLFACPAFAEFIDNGEFATDATGWAVINHGDANRIGSAGWDGNLGWYKVNHLPSVQPVETNQLVTGLTSGQTYVLTGYFKSVHWNEVGSSASLPEFRVLFDSDVFFEAGETVANPNWTQFSRL